MKILAPLFAYVVFPCLISGALCGYEMGCTPASRMIVRSVADVAADACRAAFGQHPEQLPPGVSLEDFCKVEENVQPFLDTILGTQHRLAVKLGTVRTRVLNDDAGAP